MKNPSCPLPYFNTSICHLHPWDKPNIINFRKWILNDTYVDRNQNSVIVLNNEGTTLNTFTSEEEYIGYPTFGPGGEFIYYTADLSDDPDSPIGLEMGNLHRAAPINAPAETLLNDPGLLLPTRFYNGSQIIVQWLTEDDFWGLALVGIDGSVQVLDFPIGASFITIAP